MTIGCGSFISFRARLIAGRLILALGVFAAAGCSGERFGSFDSGPAAGPPRPTAPPVNMAGRWILSSPGGGQCNMTFGAAAQGAAEGSIAPEGGCPGLFYTSRKWVFDSSGLSIRNHNGEPLAQLSAAAGGRFDGTAASGQPVALSR